MGCAGFCTPGGAGCLTAARAGGGGRARFVTDIADDELPLAVCVPLVGGGGGGLLTSLACLASYSRANCLIKSFSSLMISLLKPVPSNLPSKSSKKCVQDGSTPVEVKPDLSS